jgi:photosystem II stability/assembly factor-like uncharacterized protein
MSCIRRILVALCFGCMTAVLPGFAAAKWERIESHSLAWLHSVYFINENKGWAVGSSGAFLTTDDGGGTWKQTFKVTSDNIRDAYFYDDMRGWLLCERNQFSKGTQSTTYFLKTIDSGKTWERFELQESNVRLVRLVFSKKGIGFAVGEGGAIWQLLDDEKTWKRVGIPSDFLMLDGQFVGDFSSVIVGGGGVVLLSRDAGVEWKTSAVNPKQRLYSVFFVDENTGWVAGANGHIFATNDGGQTWLEQSAPTSKDLFDIYFTDRRTGYAVGDGGKIVQTNDGGLSWLAQESNVKGKLERLMFAGKTGIAVGYGGIILRFCADNN